MSTQSNTVCGPGLFAPVVNDGNNHVNIYSNAQTLVGRMASNFQISNTPTELGEFHTLEGLYHVLRITDYFVSIGKMSSHNWDELVELLPEVAELRDCSGADAIRTGRKYKQLAYGGTKYKPGAFSDAAEFIFVSALVNKLASLTIRGVAIGNILAEYVVRGVPLTHYYVYVNKVTWPPFYDWLPKLIAEIVQHIDPYDVSFDTQAVIEKMRGNYGLA